MARAHPRRKLRIGIVCYPTFGGSGVVATELGLNLIRRGHEVHFICYAVPLRLREYHKNLYYHVVDVLPYPLFKFAPYDLALASTIVEVVRKHRLEMLHVHYAVPHSISAYLAREMLGAQATFKTVTTLHGTDITLVGADKSYRVATHFGIARSDGVTAVSRYLAQATQRRFGADLAIRVIPNCVNLTRFRPARRRLAGKRRLAQRGEKILVHASNFRAVKRVADVVKIFHRVQHTLPARLVLLGDGPEMSHVVALVDKLRLRDRVTFFGPIEDVENVLPYTDLFLLPSGKPGESFGLAALESMACGVPVIASREGGTPEVIDDGENGYLCAAGDVAGMAAQATAVLSSPARLLRLGRAARRKAETAFPPEGITAQYEALYFELLDRS
ncbi:MAG: N-acetyl-alpha-D-glucosaminyl L-malate synthase BshA [Planctomycetes bacterium]|nr:N-acetyl-alpha-D-glucosaminyl L-malate synthase BshA [Planctomycetota bacterium]